MGCSMGIFPCPMSTIFRIRCTVYFLLRNDSLSMMILSDGKGKERRGIPITNIISSDLVAETKRIFKKEERLVEIIYNGDNHEDTIRIKLDDKHVDEFLKRIEALKQNSSDSVYWTYRSLSYQKGTGHITTVDIYPLAPFLAEGEEIVWHNAGLLKKRLFGYRLGLTTEFIIMIICSMLG